MTLKVSIEDVKALSGIPCSCVKKVEGDVVLCLHPIYASNIAKGVTEELNAMSSRYSKLLGGIPMAYENVRISRSGGLVHTSPFMHFRVKATFYVFSPEVGSTLDGVVKWKSIGNLGCLVHKIFNVSIPRPKHCRKWKGDDFCEGQELTIVVTDVDMSFYLPMITGRLASMGNMVIKEEAKKKKKEVDSGISSNTEEETETKVKMEYETKVKKEKKEKKKKDKQRNLEEEEDADEGTSKKKKKKKKRENVDCDVKAEMEWDLGEYVDSKDEKRKKKKKKMEKNREDQDDDDQDYDDHGDDVDIKKPSKKEKKKKRRSDDEDESEGSRNSKRKLKNELITIKAEVDDNDVQKRDTSFSLLQVKREALSDVEHDESALAEERKSPTKEEKTKKSKKRKAEDVSENSKKKRKLRS